MPIKTTYDADADALYIRLSDEKPFEAEDAGPVTLHYTEDGKVVGVEVLSAKLTLAPGAWSDDESSDGWKEMAAE